MAIQFNCPYCTAAIRVADHAAGKVGACPKCAAKLRVPAPAAPPAQVAPVIADGTAAKFVPESEAAAPVVEREEDLVEAAIPDLSINTAPSPVSPDPNRGPFDFAEPPASGGGTSYAEQLRSRKGRKWGALIVPLILGGILISAGVVYWWAHRDTMSGELAGELLDRDHTLAAVVPTAQIDVPDAELRATLDSIRETPVTITSELMYVELRGDPRGIRVLLEPGPEASLVRADLRPNRLLAKYYADHAGDLDTARRETLQAGAKQFVEDWQNTSASGMLLGNTVAYRDSLGLNSLLKGLGFHVGAVVGGTMYPCVHEDDEGRLYFIVPRETSRFEITPRPTGGPDRLPKEFHFTITVARPQPPQQSPAVGEGDDSAPSTNIEQMDASPARAERGDSDGVPMESGGSR